MTKTEWKKQILRILASKLQDMFISDPDSSHEIPSDADEVRICEAKDELMAEFMRRSQGL